jgi:taurine dioxygenase
VTGTRPGAVGVTKPAVTRRIAVTPLTSTIGARVDGVDLREDLTEDVREQLRQALWDHHVVVIPQQAVGLDGQNRLCI